MRVFDLAEQVKIEKNLTFLKWNELSIMKVDKISNKIKKWSQNLCCIQRYFLLIIKVFCFLMVVAKNFKNCHTTVLALIWAMKTISYFFDWDISIIRKLRRRFWPKMHHFLTLWTPVLRPPCGQYLFHFVTTEFSIVKALIWALNTL